MKSRELLVGSTLAISTLMASSACSYDATTKETAPVIWTTYDSAPDPLQSYSNEPKPTITITVPELVEPTNTYTYPSQDIPSENENITPEDDHSQELIQSNAPLNIIFVPNSIPNYSHFDDKGFQKYTYKKLLSSDLYTSAISEILASATSNRYEPNSVSIVKASELAIENCIDNSDLNQQIQITEHATELQKEDSINILLVDQDGCRRDNGISALGGYAGHNGPIVITRDSLLRNYIFGKIKKDEYKYYADINKYLVADTMTHEIGHYVGLPHAGTMKCEDPVRIINCEKNPTDDRNSTMGYTKSEDAKDFTAPELQEIGLLNDQEIISNPESGTYKLFSSSDKNIEHPKLISIETSDKTLMLSWEPDSEAPNDILCEPKNETSHSIDDLYYSVSRFFEEYGEDRLFYCYKVNKRSTENSLQVRMLTQVDDSSLEAFTGLVLRPDRAPDPVEEVMASGEVIDDTVVYQDDEQIITFVGVDKKGRAIVKIDKNQN